MLTETWYISTKYQARVYIPMSVDKKLLFKDKHIYIYIYYVFYKILLIYKMNLLSRRKQLYADEHKIHSNLLIDATLPTKADLESSSFFTCIATVKLGDGL